MKFTREDFLYLVQTEFIFDCHHQGMQAAALALTIDPACLPDTHGKLLACVHEYLDWMKHSQRPDLRPAWLRFVNDLTVTAGNHTCTVNGEVLKPHEQRVIFAPLPDQEPKANG